MSACLTSIGLKTTPTACGGADSVFLVAVVLLTEQAFFSGDKKAHGMVFEIISFPDGMVGRAFGPVAGRHHDLYLARMSGLLALITNGALRGFCLFGDKAYVGFGANIIHPFVGAVAGSLQSMWNEYTSGYRIEVEHVIGNIYSRWACLQQEQALKQTFLRFGFKPVC